MSSRSRGTKIAVGDPHAGVYESRETAYALTPAALTGASFTRPPGSTNVAIVGTLTVTGGSGTIRLILEGSNDGGTNWHVVSQSDPTDLFSTNGDVKALGLNGLASVGRYQSLRVRAVEVTDLFHFFSLSVQVTLRPVDGDFTLTTTTLVRAGSPQNGAAIVREAGVQFATVQAVMSALVLGAATSISVNLQGSPDGGTTWVTIATASFTGTGSSLLAQSVATLIDLGSYTNLRVQGVDVGGAATSYTVAVHVGWDTSDIGVGGGGQAGGSSSSVLPSMVEALLEIKAGTPGAEAANVRSLDFTCFDFEGKQLARQIYVRLILTDTAQAGVEDLSTNATFNAVTTGTALSALNTNDIVILTDQAGQLTVDILDAAAETVYCAAIPGGTAQPNGGLFYKTSETTLVFA